MSKCILLVRVSTDAQDLTQQTEKVKQEALKDGFTDENIIIIEDKESAVKLSEEERNGLNMLKHYIATEDIKCVYSYEVSRISRQGSTLYHIRDLLVKNNIQLVILKPYIKLLNDDGTISETSNLFFGLFVSLSENEGYLRKQRCKRGIDRKKKLGLYNGGNIPMGYDVIDDKFVINEDEAKIVRRVFNDYISGKSLLMLGREILSEGTWKTKVTTDTGMKQNLLNMISNQIYYGDNQHPAIITKQIYEAARQKAQDKRFYPKGNEDTAIFRGFVHDINGKTLTSNIKNKFYFTKGVTISFKVTDTILWGITREWYSQIYEGKRNEIISSLKEQLQKQENIIKTMKVNISKNSGKIDKIEERYIEGRITKERADELERKAFNELQGYKVSLQNAESERQRLSDLIENDDTMIDINGKLSITEKRSIVNYIIDNIIVRKLSFYVAEITISNKLTGETRILVVRTNNCEILDMKVNMQQALPPA